jgi:ribosomal protein L7/L12
MPVETIKCRECGSADVTEFKPGSYVCAHCEAIFKHVLSGGTVVGCEIEGCGVTAIGRCQSCGHAFCATHQARDVGADGTLTRPLLDSCALCYLVVILENAGDRTIEVIRVIRKWTNWGLKEAKSLVDSAPGPISYVLQTEAAESFMAELRDAGANVHTNRRSQPDTDSRTQ